MIDRKSLLDDLKKLLARVEADLLARSADTDVPEIGSRLRAEYDRARAAKRTAATYEEWRTDRITQAAVAWVLSSVFVRFLEDNDLISPPRIAGPGDRLSTARDTHQHFFTSRPRETDRDYLLSILDELAALPGTADILGGHNALREIPTWLSGDAAKDIIQFFQKIDANTGFIVHDFSDPSWDTRFLGDLYQDLSAFARERYALLQTPHFVEQFLLDRTLEPALAEFGLTDAFKMIDPACGSGHLVLGSFTRILDRWQRQEPATPIRELVRRTLANVHGVDINPFAVAIARFRLLLVAMRACGIAKLADAPAFHLNIECGDSLLHAPLIGGVQELFDMGTKGDTEEECDHAYASEDLRAVKALLRHGQYHAVMANPPYIVVRDGELNARYRKRFATCHRQYSLAVPFMEHIYRLCVPGGFTGQITANSFMKREFGKKLIEQFFPKTDLTHVIDTSGAYIPGHGTPTVILFGRRRQPVDSTVRAVMGIRGEPSTPDDPAKGLVWTAITTQVDQPGSQSEFVSVADTPRTTFHAHPWSIGGGGAADLKYELDNHGCRLSEAIKEIGTGAVTREDQVYIVGRLACRRKQIPPHSIRPLVEGECVRDWIVDDATDGLWPYDPKTLGALHGTSVCRFLWRWRLSLAERVAFGMTQVERGQHWTEYSMFFADRFRTPHSITFAEVATHNHFVLDRGGKVFTQTAPVIKLLPDATEDDHLALLGILNSSTVCFWMKQVCHQKQMMGGDGIRIADKSKVPYAFNGTALAKMPLPEAWAAPEWRERLIESTRRLDSLASEYAALAADVMLKHEDSTGALREKWNQRAARRAAIRSQQVYLQERIDFLVYRMFGLIDDDTLLGDPEPPNTLGLSPGGRPFCLMAGQNSDGFPVPSGIPSDWPEAVRNLWRKRITAIQSSASLRLIETSMYKRRWIGRQGLFNHARTTDELRDAIETFLLVRMERFFDFDGRMNDAGTPTATLPIALVSIGELATAARRDPLFMEAAEVFTGDIAFDVTGLITKLVDQESVPLLPILRYKDSGGRKHVAWQEVWDLQRQEDAIDARTSLDPKNPQYLTPEQATAAKRKQVGDIPVPPKYTSADFMKAHYWRLRGKLDVPKERFVSFPHVLGQDGTPMIAWAGLDHLQLAKAIGDFYGMVQTEYGGSDDPRLVPLLANLSELLPWVHQWHAESLPDYGGPPADFYEQFIRDEAASRSLTWDQIRTWQPPAATRAKKAAKKASKRAAKKKQAEEDTEAEDQDQIA